ncbi:hypothetical protein EELLY_v1c02870 [Entomoplasma ellychniae]|uniref:HNH endonuclease n=1 Tax=Entomoplasma ellychniae TaxID=2114 RepID=A0A8E2UCP5_9MOLU|nr:HNH endonuclease signature motif containing protein [Entomoplasma ellychniae]PPE04607.1 hypothetical protein EELLY_v1c02870 [Entomoplasma ellychniae]
MKIFVPNNLIQNLIILRNRDWKEKLSQDQILLKIKDVLIYDEIIKMDEKLEFEIIKEKFQGIFIEDKKSVIYFTQMLSFKGMPRSRNTFLSQNFEPAYKFALKNNSNISVSINPFDLSKSFSISAESINKDFKTLLSMSVIINKSMPIKYNENFVFLDLKDYISTRNNLKSKNKGNNSIYIKIFEDDKNITVYGKVEGANYSDSVITCRIISKLNSEKFSLYFFNLENDSSLSKTQLNTISEIGFTVIDYIKEENDLANEIKRKHFNDEYEEIVKRNQMLFFKNIIQKYIGTENFDLHKCFACDYIIDSNFIASHIHRFADICKDFEAGKIDIKLATHLAVSGENGFLLCPNQDKEFEKGLIYFDIETKKFVPNESKLNNESFEQINKRIKNQDFSKIKYNKEFSENLIKHLKRINL